MAVKHHGFVSEPNSSKKTEFSETSEQVKKVKKIIADLCEGFGELTSDYLMSAVAWGAEAQDTAENWFDFKEGFLSLVTLRDEMAKVDPRPAGFNDCLRMINQSLDAASKLGLNIVDADGQIEITTPFDSAIALHQAEKVSFLLDECELRNQFVEALDACCPGLAESIGISPCEEDENADESA